MNELITRLDRDSRQVYWRLHDNDTEFLLSELLEHGYVFSDLSTVAVKFFRNHTCLAIMVYKVSYDTDTNSIALDGLKGHYENTSIFETFLQFGNEHLSMAISYDCVARFKKIYLVDLEDLDSADLPSNYGEEAIG